jgi:hypothetical protein
VPTQVTCPGCQRPLRIADGVTQPWVTCPRCLARVANPQAQAAGGPDGLEVDYEVRRDVQKTGWLLVVLAGLGALTLLWVGRAVIKSTGDLLTMLTGLGVLAALSAAYVLWRRPGGTPLESAGRVAVGTLALVGAIVAIGLAAVAFLFALCATGALKSL